MNIMIDMPEEIYKFIPYWHAEDGQLIIQMSRNGVYDADYEHGGFLSTRIFPRLQPSKTTHQFVKVNLWQKIYPNEITQSVCQLTINGSPVPVLEIAAKGSFQTASLLKEFIDIANGILQAEESLKRLQQANEQN